MAKRVSEPFGWRTEAKELAFDDVVRLQAEAEQLLAGQGHEVESRRVLEWVRDSQCTAYDCEVVVLAIELGVKVFTMDKKLLTAFSQHTRALSAT